MSQPVPQIVAFPFPSRELAQCHDYRDAVFQLKMQAAKLLNKVAAGTYQLSPENVEGIQDVNRRCREVGLTPLDFDEVM